MNVYEIRRLATLFRRAADIAKEKGDFREMPFADFPNACCGDAPELLAQFLINHDNTVKCRYVYGNYRYDSFENNYGHAWLEVDGSTIVDITADQRQFKNTKIFPDSAAVPCYVGEMNAFYALFEENPRQSYRFYDLRCLPPAAYNRMQSLYDTITTYVEEQK